MPRPNRETWPHFADRRYRGIARRLACQGAMLLNAEGTLAMSLDDRGEADITKAQPLGSMTDAHQIRKGHPPMGGCPALFIRCRALYAELHRDRGRTHARSRRAPQRIRSAKSECRRPAKKLSC